MMSKGNSRQKTKKRVKTEIYDRSNDPKALFLKKYEILIMLLGAGIISILIFFVFLKPSDQTGFFSNNQKNEQVSVKDLQTQIDRLSNMADKAGSKEDKSFSNDSADKITSKQGNTTIDYKDHEKRIERIEASLSIKYETLAGRIKKLERTIDKLSHKIDASKKSFAPIVKQPSVKTSKKSETKQNIAKKKVVKKKQSIFHTVQKGDTLYSLSKKYNIAISKLEEINHLPKNANIYPGDNLLVK